MTIAIYKLKVRDDSGITNYRITASSEDAARKEIMDCEGNNLDNSP